jgi:hypothetical protein
LRGLQEESLAGRRGAQSSIARIQGDFVAPSQADILAQSGTIEEALRGQIARERSDSQNTIFEQMNAMGINPGARLGRLDEWQAQQNLEAQPNALARALQLMSGQQNLQGNALALLRGSLDSGTGAAQNLLNFQSSQNSAAAQQALALAAMNRDNGIGAGVNNAFNAAAQGIFLNNYRQDDAPGEPTPRNTNATVYDPWRVT